MEGALASHRAQAFCNARACTRTQHALAPHSVWRIDSGDYEAGARLVLDAWEGRCQALEAQGVPSAAWPPQPLFINSELGSVQEILQVRVLRVRLARLCCTAPAVVVSLPHQAAGGRES